MPLAKGLERAATRATEYCRSDPITNNCLMTLRWTLLLPFLMPLGHAVLVPAQPFPPDPDRRLERLIERAGQSVVVVHFTDRDGERKGMGTGFVIDGEGLIATNLHVIGEARAIYVTLPDGRSLEVKRVHASDRALDLALIGVEAEGLPALELGDSNRLGQGQPIIVLGHPLGFERSAVPGIISGVRRIDDRRMIQITAPIEPGNSGGPVLDLEGRVCGLVTTKSLIRHNLGFAVPVNQLKALLERPNPVPMSRWLTIGAIDGETWQPRFAGSWRQRAGRIVCVGGGEETPRSILGYQRTVPDPPMELCVNVRLEEARGPAGLAFHAEADRYYAFYAGATGLRLGRFDGPDPSRWVVLAEAKSRHYRPGRWNKLKVRIGRDRIHCFVNDEPVIESTDGTYRGGEVGLAALGDARAEFRDFRIGKRLAPSRLSAVSVARINQQLRGWDMAAVPSSELVDRLAAGAGESITVIRQRADTLNDQADQLRGLADLVHRTSVRRQLSAVLDAEESGIDLFHAALLIAEYDNEEVDVSAYRGELDRMAAAVRDRLQQEDTEPDDAARLDALNEYLFKENGFHGSRMDYYNRSNSYMNEVIDDREGIPITLSVLYIELGRRIGLDLVGAPLPGHFMVRHRPGNPRGVERDEVRLIDVFDGGRFLTRDKAGQTIRQITGMTLTDEHLEPALKRSIVIRMLRNLMNVARQEEPVEGPLHYLDVILDLAPDSAEDRLVRALLRAEAGRGEAAREDTRWLLDHESPGIDLSRVRELQASLAADRD